MKVTAIVLAALVACVSASFQTLDFTGSIAGANEIISATLGTGDLLRIALPENPTTGYVWRYANPFESKENVFSVEMDDYTASPNPNVYAGTGGVRSILLKAEVSGQQDFEIILVRSWEVQDFVENHNASGDLISISDIPNAGYKKVTINVNQ